jgi:hypothetical protein
MSVGSSLTAKSARTMVGRTESHDVSSAGERSGIVGPGCTMEIILRTIDVLETWTVLES